MDAKELKELHGRVLKIEPWPQTRSGRLKTTTQHNQWRLLLVSPLLVVLNSTETPHRLAVEGAKILGLRGPACLRLDGQVMIDGDKARLEPLVAKRR
ncbi:MAG: hypothetical protein KGM24_09250 [Elusimicrobia bacterium]|nr:hypothetical protein [Elusimicrobiota bacterium]